MTPVDELRAKVSRLQDKIAGLIAYNKQNNELFVASAERVWADVNKAEEEVRQFEEAIKILTAHAAPPSPPHTPPAETP